MRTDLPELNLAALAADIVGRIPGMLKDSASNNADLVAGLIRDAIERSGMHRDRERLESAIDVIAFKDSSLIDCLATVQELSCYDHDFYARQPASVTGIKTALEATPKL